VLISPSTEDSWLAKRLARFGPTPCAFLIGSRDLDASHKRPRIGKLTRFGDIEVAWFDRDPLLGRWLGIAPVQ
jgi:hypothetical protein